MPQLRDSSGARRARVPKRVFRSGTSSTRRVRERTRALRRTSAATRSPPAATGSATSPVTSRKATMCKKC